MKTKKILEISGTITLILSILGLTDISTTSWQLLSTATLWCVGIGAALAIISIAITIAELTGKHIPVRLRSAQTAILMVFGAIVFFCLPEYLTETKALQENFWAIVSIYSLPAICVEGALFNMFFYHSNKGDRKIYEYLFTAYATFAVGINFVSLSQVITTDQHILWARLVIIVAIMAFTIVKSRTLYR
jgi:hypothetical protein